MHRLDQRGQVLRHEAVVRSISGDQSRRNLNRTCTIGHQKFAAPDSLLSMKLRTANQSIKRSQMTATKNNARLNLKR
jgi:PBP1b-binding outer membrane lipoprotein LpoB